MLRRSGAYGALNTLSTNWHTLGHGMLHCLCECVVSRARNKFLRSSTYSVRSYPSTFTISLNALTHGPLPSLHLERVTHIKNENLKN